MVVLGVGVLIPLDTLMSFQRLSTGADPLDEANWSVRNGALCGSKPNQIKSQISSSDTVKLETIGQPGLWHGS